MIIMFNKFINSRWKKGPPGSDPLRGTAHFGTFVLGSDTDNDDNNDTNHYIYIYI